MDTGDPGGGGGVLTSFNLLHPFIKFNGEKIWRKNW